MTMLPSNPWWGSYRSIIPPNFAKLLADLDRATRFDNYIISTVHGLLQTEAYARAVLTGCIADAGPKSVEERVKLRMERQWHVFEQPKPPKLHFIIGEQVLHRQVGGVEVLREQLLHLSDMAILPNITLQVVPLAAYVQPFLLDPSSCNLLGFGDSAPMDVMYLEDVTGVHRSTNRMEIMMHRQRFDRASQTILTPEASLGLIKHRAKELLYQNRDS